MIKTLQKVVMRFHQASSHPAIPPINCAMKIVHVRAYKASFIKVISDIRSSKIGAITMTKMPSSCPSPGWATFRNILMVLIAMQLIILIAIGFSTTPDDESSLQDFFQPAEDALESLLASIRSTPSNSKKQNTRNSIGYQFEQIKKLSEEWEHVGPFDTPGAYTNNFVPERKHPAFRKAIPSVKELDQTVAESMKQVVSQLSSGETVTPCRYHDMHKGTVRVLQNETCRRRTPLSGEIVAYNSMPFERTWCGKTIPPHSIQRYETLCQEPASLYNIQMPPVNGRGVPLPTLKRVGSNAELKALSDCNIPCLATMDTCQDGTGEACLPESSNWIVDDAMKFTFSKQTTAQNGNVRVDPKASRNNQYFATRSFSSEIPLSYFSWQTYGRTTPAVDYNNTTKATSFFKSNPCNGSIRGDVWANYTSLTTRLDSYGTCFHNTDVPSGMSLDNKEDRQALLKKYMFHLVIDNSQDPDYVDEEVWEALRAGVIPVYFGAPNIKDHVPPDSIISAADYKTKVATAEIINQVANNRSLWEKHHEWRKNDFPQDLKAKYDFLRVSPLCRMCRWSFAKKYGLAWNHGRQKIEEKTLNGRPCFTKRGVIKFPFSERWMTPTVARPARGTCNWKWPNNVTIIATDLNVNRTVHQHDGVIDIVVRELRHTEWVVLRIEFEDMKNDGGAYFPNVHQQVPSDRTALLTSVAIQDEQSRVTVLCDWPTKAYSPSPGVIQIEIQGNGEKELQRDEIRTLRVIPEDLDSLRDTRTEFSMSPYSKSLIEDFANGLELFIVSKS
jgi:hypothetical protein